MYQLECLPRAEDVRSDTEDQEDANLRMETECLNGCLRSRNTYDIIFPLHRL